MLIYSYNKDTSEFTMTKEAVFDTHGNKFLIPAFFTSIEPLVFQEGQAIVFQEGVWVYIEDNRGQMVYSKETRQEKKWNEIGAITPEWTDIKPNSRFDEWNGVGWVFSLINYKLYKKNELQVYIETNTLDWLNYHTWSEVLTAWNNFKTNASSWTTKQDIDSAFDTAMTWLMT